MAIPNPYVGPQPFSRDQPLFGRDREVAELRALITAERIVLLYSPSGAGKSSLVQAGLIPQLSKRFDVPGPTRVNTEAPKGVRNRFVWSAIAGLAKTDRHDDITLAEYAAQHRGERNALIIIDQFEEILRIDPTNAEPKREFFSQLGDMLSAPGIWALLILREDYLAPLDPYARFIPTHLQNRYRIDRLTVDGAEKAIAKPVEQGSRKYGAGVVSELVRNLAKVRVQKSDGSIEEQAGEYVEPLQLQVVCFDLWERMERDHPTTMVIGADDIGDVSGALKSYYDNAVRLAASPFPPKTSAPQASPADPAPPKRIYDEARERAIREWFQSRLITTDGVRNQVRQEPGSSSGGLDNGIIQDLLDTYLVRGEPRGSSTWFELAHDRLVAPVQESNRDWLDAHLNKLQKGAKLWISQSRKAALLLAGEELGNALTEAQGIKLQPDEEEFLEASQAQASEANRKAQAEQREKDQAEKIRRRNIYLRVALACAVLAMFAAGLALRDARKSEKTATDARATADRSAADAQRSAGEARLRAVEARARADEARSAETAASKAEQDAKGALSAADTAIVQLFAEKARNSDVKSDGGNSPDDALSAWMYAIATLDRAKEPGPDVSDVAGLLLFPDFFPGQGEDDDDSDQDDGPRVVKAAMIPGTEDIVYSEDPDKTSSILKSDNADRKLPAALTAIRSKVLSLAVDSSGKKYAVGLEHGWLFLEGNAQPVKWDEGGDDQITALALGKKYLAAGTSEGRLLLFDMSSGKPVAGAEHAAPEKKQPLQALAWSRESNPALAAGYADGSVYSYSVADGASGRPALIADGRPMTQRKGAAGVTSLAFWPDSGLIVSGHADGSELVIERASGAVRADAQLHDLAVVSLEFDEKAKTLKSLSTDGDTHWTNLRPNIFGTDWPLKVLFSGEEGREMRHRLLEVSEKKLGYTNGSAGKRGPVDTADLIATENSRAAAIEYFGDMLVQQTHFTQAEAKSGLLTMRHRTADAAFPAIAGNTIGLMPDQLQGARAAVMHRSDLKDGFKAEFEYQMANGASRDARDIGDGMAFMFYKDRTPYEKNTLKAPDFGFEFGNGYGVVFNAYEFRNPGIGLRLYSPTTPADNRPEAVAAYDGVYGGEKWVKVCIDVLPRTGAQMCVPDAAPFQGINIYVDGKKVLSHPEPTPLNTTFGGFGFAAATGEAVMAQNIRNVKITRAGASSPDANLAFRADNTISLARIGNSDARIAQSNYPTIQADGKVVLTVDQRYSEASAVLLGGKDLPKDYAVDFEYSTKNAASSDPGFTGYGLVFMFGKDRKPYLTQPLSDPAAHGFLPGSGYGVHFNIYGRRSIELCGPDGCGPNDSRALATSTANARSLPDIYTNGQWRRVRVEVNKSAGTVRVLYEGAEVLNAPVNLTGPNDAVGFGASTGLVYGDRITSENAVRNVVITDLNRKSARK